MAAGNARILALALACATLLPAAARADDRKEAAQLYLDGKTAYEEGRLEEALGAFQAAYALFPHPGFLLRIGICQHDLGRYRDAIPTLEAYLQEKPDAEERPEIEERLAAARGAIEEQVAEDPFFTEESDDPLALAPLAPPQDAEAGAQAPAEGVVPASATRVSDETTLALEAGPEAEPDGDDALILAPIPAREPERDPDPGLASAPAGAVDAAPLTGPAAAEGPEILDKWWFWAAVGGAVLAAGGGVALANSPVTVTVLPEGTLGTVDRR